MNERPACPSCGGPVEDWVQHYRFVRTPGVDQYMRDGDPGFTILGPAEVKPCGCVITPAQAAALDGRESREAGA